LANKKTTGTWYIDATGALTTEKNQKVSYVIITAGGGVATVELQESDTGSNKYTFKNANSNSTQVLDFSSKPLVFSQGIFVKTLTSGASVMLVMATGGA
jgi:hypothetical protein